MSGPPRRQPRSARRGPAAAPPSPRRGRPQGGGELGGEQVEGRQAVRALLVAGRRRVHDLMVADASEGPLTELADLARDAGVPVRVAGRGAVEAAARTDAPQGVVARAEPIVPADLDELLAPPAGGPPPLLVVLDGVTDPHNLGAVMRSALCAGATGVVLGRHGSAHLTPSACKAAAGAVEYLPVALVGGIPAALASASRAGVWTVGLDAGAPVSVWDIPVAGEAVALVLGAEGRGLSRLVRQRCELLAGIPMTGPLESLNVSASAAVACFEIARRRAG